MIILYSEKFKKHYKCLTKSEKKQFEKKLALFQENPFYNSLRTKLIKGSKYLLEFSVNMDIRVIWRFKEDSIVVYLDIGHHDILKEY